MYIYIYIYIYVYMYVYICILCIAVFSHLLPSSCPLGAYLLPRGRLGRLISVPRCLLRAVCLHLLPEDCKVTFRHSLPSSCPLGAYLLPRSPPLPSVCRLSSPASRTPQSLFQSSVAIQLSLRRTFIAPWPLGAPI